ncbi:MAG: site-2 protease family protein [Clostridia bacterium]|nr:site-2 protease family protein [Clostridia bacterium]
MHTVLYVLLMLLMFGIMIFIHEFGHFITARLCGVSIKEFAVGMGPRLFSWKSKKYGTKYGMRLLPIGGFVSMVGEDEASDDENAFCNKSIWKRMIIVLTGPVMNLVLGFLLMAIMVFSMGNLASTTVAGFVDGATSNVQLQVGDEITHVDGTRVHTGNELVYEILNQGYEPIDLQVIRNGEKVTLHDVSFPGAEESGVSFGNRDFVVLQEKTTFGNLIKHSFWRSVSTVKMVYDSLIGLVTGRFGMEAVSGPVGVVEAVGTAAESGVWSVLYLVIVLSINLGVFNLIPFPALDGGRFLFLIIEGIRRKPMNKNVESYINFAGIMLLFALMILVTVKDVLHLFG